MYLRTTVLLCKLFFKKKIAAMKKTVAPVQEKRTDCFTGIEHSPDRRVLRSTAQEMEGSAQRIAAKRVLPALLPPGEG
jgi:hypothetical protein